MRVEDGPAGNRVDHMGPVHDEAERASGRERRGAWERVRCVELSSVDADLAQHAVRRVDEAPDPRPCAVTRGRHTPAGEDEERSDDSEESHALFARRTVAPPKVTLLSHPDTFAARFFEVRSKWVRGEEPSRVWLHTRGVA